MKEHIQGLIEFDYCGGIDIGGTNFIDVMYNIAENDGWVMRHSKGLGGKRAIIDECNIKMYFTDRECDLDEAEISLLTKLDGAGFFDDPANKEELEGEFNLLTMLTGYSEFTITGYNIETCTLGGHNLLDILGSHIGEYANIVIETSSW